MPWSAFRSNIDERKHILKYQPSRNIKADTHQELARKIGFSHLHAVKKEEEEKIERTAELEKQRCLLLQI